MKEADFEAERKNFKPKKNLAFQLFTRLTHLESKNRKKISFSFYVCGINI